MTLDDNPYFDPDGPWVHNAEICHQNGKASDRDRFIARVVSRWVNQWIKTNFVSPVKRRVNQRGV